MKNVNSIQTYLLRNVQYTKHKIILTTYIYTNNTDQYTCHQSLRGKTDIY